MSPYFLATDLLIGQGRGTYVAPYIAGASPAVRNRVGSQNASNTTAQNPTQATHQAGDVLVSASSTDGNTAISTGPTGWTERFNSLNANASGTSSERLVIYVRLASASGTTCSFTMAAAEQSASQAQSYSTHGVTTPTDVLVGTTASGNATATTTLPVNPITGLTVGRQYQIVLFVSSAQGTAGLPTAAPSGFSNFLSQGTGTVVASSGICVADTLITASSTSYQPPSWTRSSSNVSWQTIAIAVPGP